MADKTLSKSEIEERVAILNRLRQLLLQQRQKFQEYLTVLEKQELVIQKEDTEGLLAHTELEQNILTNINTLQKVITPLEVMYKSTAHKDDEIPLLKADLLQLQQEVLEQNMKNRQILKSHMTNIRTRLAQFKNPYKNSRSVYSTDSHTASIISVEL
jgi:hypothetical protein